MVVREPILRKWRRKFEARLSKWRGDWEEAGEPTLLPKNLDVTYPDCPECGAETQSKVYENGVKCSCGWSSGGGAI